MSNLNRPTVFLVGAGPGDCKLITIKALELIKSAECIIYDYLVNPALLKFADRRCKLIYVGKKSGAHAMSQSKINQLLVRQAKRYNIVVRLKGGDPFIFGRGAEEAVYLKKKGINFEIVPGVSSATGVPAYAGIPLTHRGINSTVGFITGHHAPTKRESDIDWRALAGAMGTMVFLMGVGNLSVITERLVSFGKSKDTPVAIIRWGTTPGQKTVIGNLGDIVEKARENQVTPPAIIVVGEVVRLSRELSWFERKPLFGRRILVTRARHQAGILSEKLIDMGAEVVEVPVIKVVSLKPDKYIKDALLYNRYDWIFFTSQNGVKEFSDFLSRQGRDIRILGNTKVCAIGSETEKNLRAIGIKPDYVPSEFCAEAIVEYFKGIGIRGSRVLILRSRQGRNTLPEGLKKLRAVVKTIDMYDICPEKKNGPILKRYLKEGIDVVTFTSSSTVKNFIKLLGRDYQKLLRGIKIASIGPITSRAVRKFGLKVHMEAEVYTTCGMVEAIVQG